MSNNINARTFHSIEDPELVDLLLAGGIGAMLTDTVYGIVGSARNPKAAAAVIEAKGRKHKPGTLVAANVQQLVDLGIKYEHIEPVEQFWPGAMSVVLPMGSDLEYLHTGLLSLPARIPDNPEFSSLLEKVGPLLTTSANRQGEPTATSIEEIQKIFGNSLNFYVQSQAPPSPLASTIIRVTNGSIEVLRQGPMMIP